MFLIKKFYHNFSSTDNATSVSKHASFFESILSMLFFLNASSLLYDDMMLSSTIIVKKSSRQQLRVKLLSAVISKANK